MFAYSTVLGCRITVKIDLLSIWSKINPTVPHPVRLVAGAGAMTTNLNMVWAISDVFNGLMAIPNLIGLIGLSGVVIAETRLFREQLRREEANRKVS